MSCFGDPCDRLQPLAVPAPGEHVEVWSRRAHVTARLRDLCDAKRPRWALPEWPELLEDLMRRLTPTERAALLVRFPDGDVVDAATALERGRSPWLARLLADGELFTVFQPVVDLWTGATHGREALIRGIVAGRELSGGQIVGAAQAHDAEVRVEHLARSLAVAGAGRALPAGETLYLNFNPTTVYDPEACLDSTFALAEQVGLPMSRICFEVVHTEQFPDVGFLDRILRRCREEGALVALDDLGTGHTSLDYLRRLRPDLVKLDRSLAASMQGDEHRRRLVGSLVDYAHGLDILVVAEGLESAADVATARALGADLAQGWWFGRPSTEMVPVDPALVLGARSAASHVPAGALG
jgi:EAL domain-containing protein (putative c-di-GMP-specific phosphodiesterase class I)